jgi:hypothetical protein
MNNKRLHPLGRLLARRNERMRDKHMSLAQVQMLR